ncbi:MAG: hypothetical protein WEA34_13265 [Gemmatimonadota bacterium]
MPDRPPPRDPSDRPPDPQRPDRPPDNEPPPVLTYDDVREIEESIAPPARSSRRLWVAGVLLVLLAAGGYATYVLTRPAPSEGSLELMPLTPSGPDQPASLSGSRLLALTPTDTAVTPGADVEIAVRARESGDRPASDVLVRFEIEIGSATREQEAWTDAAGVARATIAMPGRPAQAVVRVSSASLDAPGPTFRISARTGAPSLMDVTAGDAQQADAGALLPERLEVEVLDETGVPVPGVELFFEVATGGGQAAPSRTRTDTLGRASAIWRLGPAGGPQSLVVSSDEFPGSATFSATARATAEATPTAAAPIAGETPDAAAGASAGPVTVQARTRSIGGSTVCAIRSGDVLCRGANDRGQRLEGGLPGSRAVATGLFHACALDASGEASCWGANDSGQLGEGSTTDRAAPVAVATERRFSALAAGVAHSCGLSSGGRAVCWGANLGGQLGDGSRNDRAIPGLVAAETSFTRIVSGWNHTCAVTAGSTLSCWGLNREGAVGDGSRLDRLVPTRVLDAVTDVAAGSGHTCAVRQGQVRCWGANGAGQVGDGTAETRPSPTPVPDLPGPATAVATGAAHSCALVEDGTAHCWGQNLYGQLGNGSTAPSRTPRAVAGDHRFARIHAGGGVTCGITEDGAEYCWGLNQSGEIGDGTRTNRPVPTRVTRATPDGADTPRERRE